jgi:hypothetical protein
VRPSAGTTGKWQVSTTGGTYPRWRRDGKEIFFMNNDRKLMAVGVKSGSSTFEAGVPQLLFEMRLMRDAVAMISGPKPLTTPEEFKKFYQNVRDTQAKGGGVRHFNSSFVIVGMPDGTARGSSYMLGVETKTKGGRPEVQLFGTKTSS